MWAPGYGRPGREGEGQEQGSDRPAGHWVQCSRWWPLTGRLPSTTARPTGRQADERSPETLSEQVNQQQLPHPAHFATRTHTKVQGARRAQSGTVFSFQIQTPAKSRQVNLVMLALLSWSMLVAGS